MIMPRTSNVHERSPTSKSLGFFLQCNGESESSSWSCYAVAELRLLSVRPEIETFSRKIQHLFYSKVGQMKVLFLFHLCSILIASRLTFRTF